MPPGINTLRSRHIPPSLRFCAPVSMKKSKKRQPESAKWSLSSTEEKPRKVGPSGPQAQIPQRIRDAETWRLDGRILAAVLQRCRAGSESARRLLRTSFDRLIWRFATRHDTPWPDDHLITDLWIRLDELITELSHNSIPSNEVELWLTHRLRNAVPHSWRTRHLSRWAHDEIPGLLVRIPPTTRKRWNKQEKEMPKRMSLDAQGHYVAQDGKHHAIADRDTIDTGVDLALDVQAAVEKSGDHADEILAAIKRLDGHVTDRALASVLGQTRYNVRGTLDAIGSHLEAYAPT